MKNEDNVKPPQAGARQGTRIEQIQRELAEVRAEIRRLTDLCWELWRIQALTMADVGLLRHPEFADCPMAGDGDGVALPAQPDKPKEGGPNA